MGKYDSLTREELIARLEKAEQSGISQLYDCLDGEKRIAKALMLILQNYNSNYEEDIMRIVLERYQADRAFLFQFNWEEGTNSNLYEVSAEGISSEIKNLQNLPNQALEDYLEQFRQGNPLIVNDVDLLPETTYQGRNRLKQVFQQLQLKSAILFPVCIFGELWGYVGMETVRNYRNWSPNDIEWLQSFTHVLSLGVSQRFIRTRAVQNEQRFTELFRHMPVGYIHHRIVYDEAGHPTDYEFIDANPAFEKLTGLSKKECIGRTASQVTGKVDPGLLQLYAKVAQTGEQVQLDYATSLFKKWFYSVLYSPRKDEFISLFYDITERIQATEQIKQNEKKLRMIFDNLPVGTIAFDEKGNFVSANDKAQEMFGFSEPSIFPQKFQLSPSNKCQLEQKGFLELEIIYDPVACQLLQKEEELPETALFLTIRILTYTNDKNQKLGYLLIAIDNTKIHWTNYHLNQTRKALTENLVRLSLILETGKIYPWYIDPETGEVDMSEDFYKALGHRKQKHTHYNFNHFLTCIYPEDVPRFQEESKKFRQGISQRLKLEIRLNILSREYLWYEINAGVQYQGEDRKNAKWLGFLTLIQDRKDNEQRLIEALKKAEESDQLKSAFLANVSHEIRTPLNAIVGFSELIAHTDQEKDKNYYLDIVKNNNNLLLNLINDILDLSKIESGRIDLKESSVNVRVLCQEICEVHQLKAQPGVRVIFANPEVPLWMFTDRNRLIQLYSNLINNAIKNTTQGSITMGYRQQKQEIEFFVRDTGKGIPPEKQKVIFNRFEKLDYNAQGFGLGLSICKSILDKMQGNISLTSEPGKGSEFRFTLPYQPAQPAYSDKATEDALFSPSQSILIAEETDNVYKQLKNISGEQYMLLHAKTGIEAINLFSSGQPALILIDLHLPDLDGLEIITIIHEVSPETPVIAFSTFAYASGKTFALEAGCNDFFTKPITPQHLKQLICKYLPC